MKIVNAIRPFRIVLLILCFVERTSGQNAGTLIEADSGMVVSASEEASRVGVEVLKRGGNAVDAAVAVGFALAVTYPSAGNLGGGTYLIIRMANGEAVAIDGREVAPGAAMRDMYLDSAGNAIPDKSLIGPISSGVPGTTAALLLALEKFGTMKREDVIHPAIRLASEGFRMPKHLSQFIKSMLPYFIEFPSSMNVFYPNGRTLESGDLWTQHDLAATLKRIAELGVQGFYHGVTADFIVRQMERKGGIITHRDLELYRAIVREPVRGSYRGYSILSMPPSSSGGIALLQMLNILEESLVAFPDDEVTSIQQMLEAMRCAFMHRARYLGDPDFHTIPTDWLISKSYAGQLQRRIPVGKAGTSDMDSVIAIPQREGDQTTHYSVIDRWGNAVAVTTTLNSSCGSKCVVDGAGFLLNNEMDDFSMKPGVQNQFGLIGGIVNSIEPGKRMLSSMTPTIVLKEERPYLILGSPGGSTIITTVLQVIMNIIDHGMTLDQAVTSARFHYQWLPDTVEYEEKAFTTEQRSRLKQMGYSLKQRAAIGRVDAIMIDTRTRRYRGFSDPRGYGAAIGY